MHNTALVERSAQIIWGAKQLGAIYPLAREGQPELRHRLPLHAVGADGRWTGSGPAGRARPHPVRAAPAARPARRRGRPRRQWHGPRGSCPRIDGVAHLPRAAGRHRHRRGGSGGGSGVRPERTGGAGGGAGLARSGRAGAHGDRVTSRRLPTSTNSRRWSTAPAGCWPTSSARRAATPARPSGWRRCPATGPSR